MLDTDRTPPRRLTSAGIDPAGAGPEALSPKPAPDNVRTIPPWESLAALAGAFRDRARDLAPYSRAAAAAWHEAAARVLDALGAADDEVLTIVEAAREAGWSYEGLRRRVMRDPALNAGTARAPAVTRRQLRALGRGRHARPGIGMLHGPHPRMETKGFASDAPAGSPTRPAAPGAAAASPSSPTRLAAIVGSAVASRRRSRRSA
jgi:hypothetical protein